MAGDTVNKYHDPRYSGPIVIGSLALVAVVWGARAMAEEPEPFEPAPEEPGCISATWSEPDGSIAGPFVTCPLRGAVIPGLASDGEAAQPGE